MLRTKNCGEIRSSDLNQKVTLCGWVRNLREHPSVIFADLEDFYGRTQVCINKNLDTSFLSKECVIQVQGVVTARPEGTVNFDLPTGEIEIQAEEILLLCPSKILPFEIRDNINVREDLRLKYRYLDLRRPKMAYFIRKRYEIVRSIRKAFDDMDFIEIETPMFVRSTPEGSRDFLVPSRTYPGEFYALPQSPQLYKQLLMVAGFDRYYQFPRCFRDEDARRARQLVHTQIDIEMAFVEEEDIRSSIEYFIKKTFLEVLDVNLETPFPKFTYKEAISRWGIDKPDLRFAMELLDLTDLLSDSGIPFFKASVENNGIIKGIVASNYKKFSRKEHKELEAYVSQFGAQGLSYLRINDEECQGNFHAKLKDGLLQNLIEIANVDSDSILFIISGKAAIVNRSLGELRNLLARKLDLIPKGEYNFLWVTDFPLFEWDEEQNNWAPMHHIFTMPKKEYIDTLEKNQGNVSGSLFDLVLNGVELGSGSIRINNPDLQKRIMKIVGIAEEEAMTKFGFLLNAYEYGGPVHGGFGIGLDNLVMTMLGLTNIRDVIAFPNSSSGAFLHDDSPTAITKEQLDELHIKISTIHKDSKMDKNQ